MLSDFNQKQRHKHFIISDNSDTSHFNIRKKKRIIKTTVVGIVGIVGNKAGVFVT